jgi:hypothetical protein
MINNNNNNNNNNLLLLLFIREGVHLEGIDLFIMFSQQWTRGVPSYSYMVLMLPLL